MSVNAYKFIITLYGTPFIRTLLLVCVFAIAELSFVGPQGFGFFSCFHAKRKAIFFLMWSVEYFLILAVVFCLVLCLEYYRLLIWIGFCFLRSFCLPEGEACPAVHSPLEGSALLCVVLTLPEAAEVTEGICRGTKLLFPHPRAALAGHLLLLLNEGSGQTPLSWLEVHVQFALAAAK